MPQVKFIPKYPQGILFKPGDVEFWILETSTVLFLSFFTRFQIFVFVCQKRQLSISLLKFSDEIQPTVVTL